jgi:hypothetical protein
MSYAGSHIRFTAAQLAPLDDKAGTTIRHLRRVRKLIDEYPNREVVLCAGISVSQEDLMAILQTHTDDPLVPKLMLASKWPAHTRDQYESFSTVWPIKAKPEKKRSSSSISLILDQFRFNRSHPKCQK